MDRTPAITVAIVVLGLAIALIIVMRPKPSIAPTTNDAANINPSSAGNINVSPTAFTTDDLPDRDPHFDFTATLPEAWIAEYVASSRAINFYNPQAAGQSFLAKSQIFVIDVESADFEQPAAGTVISQEDVVVNGYVGRRYELSGQSAVGGAGRPTWLNEQHRQVDLRPTAGAARYYSFSQSPDVSNAIFDQFLQSVRFGSGA